MKSCLAATLVSLAIATVACGGDDEPEAEADRPPKPLSLVAIGDSLAERCRGCTSLVDRRVEISNHSVAGAEPSDVLAQVKRDGATRQALAGADLVVVGLGAANTARRSHQTTVEAILDELDTLRAGGPTALWLLTTNRTQCRLVRTHRGRCVDLEGNPTKER